MENIREFLNWLVNEPDFNIIKDDIQELLDDYKTFKNSQHPDETPKVSTNKQAKEYCGFTVESSCYCSRYHDCKFCYMQPRKQYG